ncbi:SRPBCC domain-containing protein [Hyphococcus sp.]|uniref:SRPBCC domain-containing protein n=1 Tax=Hyphococcus sp. TaxID=2038636 RepID=UPI003CCB9ED1
MPAATTVEPIVKTLELNVSAERAFHHFTENIQLWWPKTTHSLAQEDAETVKFETRTGGRVYEIEKSGKEREWGRVLVCDAPNRLVFSWVLEAPDKATEVEVAFRDAGKERSTLTLIHRGWDTRPDGAEWRNNYDQGWEGVLENYSSSLA